MGNRGGCDGPGDQYNIASADCLSPLGVTKISQEASRGIAMGKVGRFPVGT